MDGIKKIGGTKSLSKCDRKLEHYKCKLEK